jgi:hypothetical protein
MKRPLPQGPVESVGRRAAFPLAWLSAICLGAVCATGGEIAGQAPEPAALPEAANAARVVTRSSSGRFVVVGADSVGNSQYTRWAEEIAGRMERLLASPLPPVGGAPIEIVRVYGRLAGAALTIDCRPMGSMRRVLTVNETRVPDYERMQGSLCGLLLDQYISERQRAPGRRAGSFAVPEWFSMGISQNLAAETRNRNRKVVTGWRPVSERPGVVSVLEWRSLPEGWPRNLALCGMVVHWLGSLKEGVGAYGMILDRLAAGETVQGDWVAARLGRGASAGALEQEWRDWLSRQARAVQEFGALSTVLVEQLNAELDLVFPAEPEAGQEGRPLRRMTPAQVAAAKEHSVSLRLAASEKVQKIRAVTLGKAPELVEAGEAYCRFFELVTRGAWSPLVRRQFSRADGAYQRLARLTRARESYLDDIEREQGPEGLVLDGVAEPVLEKSRIDAYLDDVEKRFTESAGGRTDERVRP